MGARWSGRSRAALWLAVALIVAVAVGVARAGPDTSPQAATETAEAVASVTPQSPPSPVPDPVEEASDGFPTPETSGVPPGWAPARTHTGDLWVRETGAVVTDVRVVDGSIVVDAADVTLRRVEVVGGRITNVPEDSCRNGLVLEDSTVRRSTAQTRDTDEPAVGVGGYTARNVKIDGVAEGFRVGGTSMGCGPVTIEDTFVRIAFPDVCDDWHGDGIQGYDGPALTVRNTAVELVEHETCGGTAAFFYPHSQGNSSADIDRLRVTGGGFPFRLGTPAEVRGLEIVDGSWSFAPIDVRCTAVERWDARIVALGEDGRATTVREQACDTEDGN